MYNLYNPYKFLFHEIPFYLSICWGYDNAATGDDPPSPVEVHVGQGEQVGRSGFPAIEAVFDVTILKNIKN